ncbi:MAG: cytochrome c [Chloroflexota bacterium]
MVFRVTSKIGIALLIVLFLNSIVAAQDAYHGDALRGALIYDNWFVILDLSPPEGDHPLWASQSSNLRSGTITFRCTTCHGWDYKGADGAYSPNSAEYTGFKGIQGMVGATNDEIIASLDGSNNPSHDFSGLIHRRALVDLIAFIRTKQVDIALLINYEDRSALGNDEMGRDLYRETCLACHGPDGSTLNFESAANPEFIGDVALADPWRFVHRVRFGSPLSLNHSFEALGWSLQEIVDTLAYSQRLPAADPNAGQILDPSSEQAIDVAEQGQMNAINIAALVIVLIILTSQIWMAYIAKP